MARAVNKLSPAAVRNARKPGVYGDGAGLWLHVGPTGGKSWLLRFMLRGKAREMGLGPLHTVGLAEARERARQARLQLLDGVDPITARRTATRRAEGAGMTFKACAERYIAAHEAGWRNAKHAAQWSATLEAYAYPIFGDLPVADVDTGHVTRVIEPIWRDKPETASRVRGRIEAVLDYAKTHGWRTGENPARWKGHLQNVLPARGKVARVEHHAALPWQDAPAFMTALARQEGVGALALRFAILTAGRTGEVIGATWGEIDLAGALWTVPPERMKAGREHRVPLAEPALAVLREFAMLRRGDDPAEPVFPGQRAGKPLSNMALLMTLRRMARGDLTAHGFRSTFRDWAAENGHLPDIAEAALAHVVGDKTVAAYQRGDLLDRRRALMREWGEWCMPADTES